MKIMIEWIKSSDKLPTESGQYLIWLTDLCAKVAWYNEKTKMWEISKKLKLKAKCEYVTHWQWINAPVREVVVGEDRVDGC